MTLNVPITLDLNGIEALLGSIGKGSGSTTIQDPIVNEITVAVADPNATTVLDGIQATDAGSISVYGRSGRQIITILANQSQAASLAEYLVRPAPEYWFSSLEVLLNGIPSGDRDAVAELEIGDQIRVSKRFPNVANPVVQELFVEAVEHDITVDRHVVRIYCSPASLYRCFVLNVSDLDNDEYGLAATGATCSLNTFSTTNADSVTILDVAGEPYWVADWKASGSVTFDQATEVDYLVVAGGGGGGTNGGGGGAGGVKAGSVSVGAQAYTVTVGAGGVKSVAGGPPYASGDDGGNSSLGSLVVSTGGGGGGGASFDGSSGGSGGGGGWGLAVKAGGAGTSGEGFAGGASGGGGANGGGGGGGASAVGGAGVNLVVAGVGGAGVSSSITGTAVVYGGGGSGGKAGGGRTAGGSGGGGDGGGGNPSSTTGTDGVDGLGGGGGGGGNNVAQGGDGGDGRVIVRWRVYAN